MIAPTTPIDERPLLVLRRHREVGEDHQEDEDVIDRQRFLDQIAGEKLRRFEVRHFAAGVRVKMPPQEAAEDEG